MSQDSQAAPAGDDAIPWEREAANWIAWARTPGHDIFAHFAPSFFSEIVPAAAGPMLEIGCGEGRVVRELAARAHAVVGLDSAETLVRHARGTDDRPAYVVGDATSLPFAGATFTTVVAYNSLQTMRAFGDMAACVREAARVLTPGGHLCMCVAHPMTDVGHVKAVSPDGEMTVAGSYFERKPVCETVTKDGLRMTFHGWTYTLEDYLRAIEDAGLLVERLREPVPDAGDEQPHAELRRWRRLPLFLFLRAVKPRG